LPLQRHALDASKAISEESLARLIIISNKRQLGDDIEKACRDKIQRDYGSTPDQALAQATDVLNAGKPQDATRQFEAARAGARETQSAELANCLGSFARSLR